MSFSLKSASHPDCINYFRIVKKDTNYTMEEFVQAFYTEPYSIEHLLPSCHIVYRGMDLSYDEYARKRREFYGSLAFHERYTKEVYPLEMMILPSNQDYYKAAKFLKKSENCLQTARYYLACSWDKFEDNENLSWNSGYGPMFYLRTINLSTAAIWYNSCCDYLLLVVYFAFGLYKMIDGYSDGLTHEQLLKLCTYEKLGRVYSQHKENAEFKALWKIISVCYTALTTTNTWANYIKHKGGIDYIGLLAPDPYQIFITDAEGNEIAKNCDFEAITLDLDNSIIELSAAHAALLKCYDDIMDFINFPRSSGSN